MPSDVRRFPIRAERHICKNREAKVGGATEKKVLRDTLGAIIANWRRPSDECELVGFSSLKGNKWSGDLMVVGRFVNGWVDKWSIREIVEPGKLEEYLQRVIGAKYSNAEDPVKALNDEIERSPFWDAVEDVARGLNLGDGWTSRIVYSNLYRFGLDGGNPPAELCTAQRKGCIELLRDEMLEFRPSRILFLTGWEWADKFLGTEDSLIRFNEVARHRGDLDRIGTISVTSTPIPVVVSRHPQGKSRGPLVAEILKAFKDLEGRCE